MTREPVVTDRVLTIPNLLSMVRLVLVPVFAYLIVTGRDGLAITVLAASGFTDYLDGKLARRWDQVSRLGQLLDPFADRLYILTTLLGLGYRGVIPVWLVVALISRDLLLACTLPLLARYGYGPLPVNFLGKAATFNLLYAFPFVLLGAGTSTASDIARPIGWAFACWGTALYWWAAVLYLRQVRLVVRSGTLRSAAEGSA